MPKVSDGRPCGACGVRHGQRRETVAWARELLGGNGIVADYKAARFFADCEALYSYEGTYQMQSDRR
jgi:glutaryl-CoA dehydrogenase